MSFILQTGAQLGRYELLTELGRGGMASVWVARERVGASERLVAVKAMLPELASRSDFRSMFLDEGQIVRSIEHQNVVQVYEVSEQDGVLYMAMEWVEGDSLRAVIREAKRRRAIPPEMAVRMIADAAAGLHAAHELRTWDGQLRGIVHCDVSPHNILIGIDGHAKLVDFGVASATAHTDVDPNRVKGKFGYMSPEQAQAKKIDRRSDLFSLGIVLYELTTGERLFRGASPRETLKLVAEKTVPRPREVYAKYPERLERIVLRALSRDPDERFQTADEFKERLERYLIEERILVARSSVTALLKRVIGKRLARQRDAVRDALRTVEGESAAGLVPSEANTPLLDVKSGELTATGTSLSGSWTSMAASNASLIPASFSEPPTSSHTAPTATTHHPHAIDSLPTEASPRRSKWALLAGATAIVAAGATLYGLYQPGETAAPDAAATPTSAAETSDARGSTTNSDAITKENESVSLDSLPMEEAKADTPTATPPIRPQRLSKTAAAQPTRKNNTQQPQSKQVEVSLAEQADSSNGTPKPADAKTTSKTTPKLPPNNERAPLNRGAAIAALGGASLRAAGCKQMAGPSGVGQAQVSLSPDGFVQSVVISQPFAGTGVGTCVAGLFKRVSVPPFRGSPITLSRSFRIPD